MPGSISRQSRCRGRRSMRWSQQRTRRRGRGRRRHRAGAGLDGDALQHERGRRPRRAARKAPQARRDLGRACRLDGRRRIHAERLPHAVRSARDAQLRREPELACALRAARAGRADPRRQLPLRRCRRCPPLARGTVSPRRSPRVRGEGLLALLLRVRDAGGLGRTRAPVRDPRGHLQLHLRRDRAERRLGHARR